MAKRARSTNDGSAQQTKRRKRDDSGNQKMKNKDRYDKKGHYCPSNHKSIEQAKAMNNGIIPYTPALHTGRFDRDTEWNENNLPEMLFFIVPPKVKKVAPNRDANGQSWESQILPNTVSAEAPGWLMGTWLRLGVESKDILNRMQDDLTFIGGPLKKLPHPAFNNRIFRKCSLLFGHFIKDKAHLKSQQKIRGKLTERNLQLNTILEEVEIAGQQRLIKKKLVSKDEGTTSVRLVNVEVNEDNFEETTFPLYHFKLDIDEKPDEDEDEEAEEEEEEEEEAAAAAETATPGLTNSDGPESPTSVEGDSTAVATPAALTAGPVTTSTTNVLASLPPVDPALLVSPQFDWPVLSADELHQPELKLEIAAAAEATAAEASKMFDDFLAFGQEHALAAPAAAEPSFFDEFVDFGEGTTVDAASAAVDEWGFDLNELGSVPEF